MCRSPVRAPIIRVRLGCRRWWPWSGAGKVRGFSQSRLPCSRHHLDAEDRVDADLEEGRTPTRLRLRRSAVIPARISLRRVRGRIGPSRRLNGGGRWRADRSSCRSSGGNASRKTYGRTIGSGMWSFSQRRRSDVVSRKASGHQVGNEPLLECIPEPRQPRLTPGCRASTASTRRVDAEAHLHLGPAGPALQRLPAPTRRSPVAYIRVPRRACGSGTNRSAV